MLTSWWCVLTTTKCNAVNASKHQLVIKFGLATLHDGKTICKVNFIYTSVVRKQLFIHITFLQPKCFVLRERESLVRGFVLCCVTFIQQTLYDSSHTPHLPVLHLSPPRYLQYLPGQLSSLRYMNSRVILSLFAGPLQNSEEQSTLKWANSEKTLTRG